MPTNTSVLYWSDVEHGGGTITLVDETGTDVPLTKLSDNVTSTVSAYRIDGVLKPSTRYRIPNLDDEGLTYFTTAAEADTTPPPAPTLSDFSITKVDSENNDCAVERTIVTGVLSLPDAAILRARFGSTEYLLDAAGGFGPLGSSGCAIPFDVAPGAEITVTLWTEDLAGNRSAEVSATTRVEGCGEGECPDDDGGCSSGGASLGGALGVLALRRRRRC